METEQSTGRTETLDLTPTWSSLLPSMLEWIETSRKSDEARKWQTYNREQLIRLAKITDHLIARRKERDGEPKPSPATPQPPNWLGTVLHWLIKDLESKGRSKAALERKAIAHEQLYHMAEVADELIAIEKALKAELEATEV